ncbi:MAG: IS1595 family transposase [Actinomycetota bacterium]|nr:IS1595 family transposase [Actinomycetota bacterium]
MNYKEFMKKFPDEKSIIDYFIKIRYPEKVICSKCGSDKVVHRKDYPKLFQCNLCNNSFSVFKDTIFEKTTTDLQKWFFAIHLVLNAKKGISAKQLQREIGVTYKTAWRMLRQIRRAIEDKNSDDFFDTIVEIDETYVGGKPRKKNKRDENKKGGGLKRGRGTTKTPIIAVVDREERKVFARVANPNKRGQKLTGKQLLDVINQVCKGKNVKVISDEFTGYDKLMGTNYIHFRVDHTKMFVDGDIHTNTIESFWAIAKRAFYGTYHRISKKYLQDYINECSFRYNHRDINNSFDLLLANAIY